MSAKLIVFVEMAIMQFLDFAKVFSKRMFNNQRFCFDVIFHSEKNNIFENCRYEILKYLCATLSLIKIIT